MGLLTEADAWALEELAETYVEARDLRQRIAQEGRTVKITTTTGDERQVTNPLIHQLSDASKRLNFWVKIWRPILETNPGLKRTKTTS